MLAPSTLDTPIHRATIEQMDDQMLATYVEDLRQRRLRLWNVYQAGLEAKAKAKSEKDQALLSKRLDAFIKAHSVVEKNIEKLDKLAIDIQAIRLTLGDIG